MPSHTLMTLLAPRVTQKGTRVAELNETKSKKETAW